MTMCPTTHSVIIVPVPPSLREECREDFVEVSELCANARAIALNAKLV